MAKTGRTQDELPQRLVMTDLRVLIVRMMSIPNDWKAIKLMPLSSSVEWLKAVTGSQKASPEADPAPATVASAESSPAPQDDAAPTPLEGDDTPPPLEGNDAPPPLQSDAQAVELS